MIQGFRDFLFRGNVVDLAVAVVIGTAFGKVVEAVVAGVVMPLVGALFGQPRFDFTLGPFLVGNVLTAVVSFVAVAAVVYFLIVLPMNRMMERFKAREAPAAPPEASKEEALLTEIRDLLRARQAG